MRHHDISHHGNDKSKLEQYTKVTRLARRAVCLPSWPDGAIPEADGTLLDHSMVLFGSALRDGNAHNPHNLPILLGGRGHGTLTPGRHARLRQGHPPL